MDPIAADPTAAQPAAQPQAQEQTLHHCPYCGSGNVTGRSDGTVECGFCQSIFKVFAQPTHPYMPQTINGQPFEVPGSPRRSDDPVPTAGGPVPEPGAGPLPEDPAATGGLERFRVDAAPAGGAPTAGLERFRAGLRYVTAKGVALPADSYLAHLAIEHADDREAVIAQVREGRG